LELVLKKKVELMLLFLTKNAPQGTFSVKIEASAQRFSKTPIASQGKVMAAETQSEIHAVLENLQA